MLTLTLSMACAPVTQDSEPAGGLAPMQAEAAGGEVVPWSEVAHRAGRAWRWHGADEGEDEIEVVVVEGAEQWTDGFYIRRGEALLATWSSREWAEEAGWVPLLLVGFDEEPFTVGDTIVFQGRGSSEHGCDGVTWLFITFSLDEEGTLGVEVAAEGMPYFALPAEGALVAADGVAVEGVDLATLEASIVLDGVRSAELALPWGPLRIEAEEAIPWMQLQPHEDFVELDLDHSCEIDGVEQISVLLRTSM
ncbi:MAG: hypothetical protein ACI8S6_004878 [Myxococcota bacterium]|jgi:hypothetical protein